MKKTSILLAALYLAFATFTLSCSEHDHDHADGEDHTHAQGDHDKDHDDDHDKAHGDDHADSDHDHEKAIPGPNGGRVMTSVEPHLEFLVTEDRKVRITALDDDIVPIALAGQSVSAMAGDRSAPTRLAFTPDGTGLLSDVTLPEGNDFPIIVTIKSGPDGAAVREKFNVNLKDCPTCEYKEYACICDHGEEDHAHEKK